MSKLLSWLKTNSVRVLDPNREERISAFSEIVWKELKAQGRSFNFIETMSRLGADVEDNPIVAERVYEKALQKAWADAAVTERERQSLTAIGQMLFILPFQREAFERRYGMALFESALGQAFADGRLSNAEVQTLQNIAAGLNTTTGDLIRQSFNEQGEAFLRGIFARTMQGAVFTSQDWQSLVATTAALGLSEEELREAVRPQASIYVEHVLADAKSDGRITDAERKSIEWLLTTLGLPFDFVNYAQHEMAKVEQLAAIGDGRLPTIRVIGIAARAGEVIHHHCHAVYFRTRQLRSGPRTYRHDGEMTITDCRMIFSSADKSFEVNHRRVVAIAPFRGGIEIRSNVGGGQYYFSGADGEVASKIYEVAVGRANQTIVSRSEEASMRHIPRDVRQRVWQKYSGRCADCGATQYLEFDHVVPVARGGSNSEANVQLLCRGCNGKKSDHI